MNGHGPGVFAGSADLQIHERTLPLRGGELFFEPDLIRADGPDGAEYLMPFLLQDQAFPHVIPAKRGIPSQVFDRMQRIRGELSASGLHAQLAVKT